MTIDEYNNLRSEYARAIRDARHSWNDQGKWDYANGLFYRLKDGYRELRPHHVWLPDPVWEEF